MNEEAKAKIKEDEEHLPSATETPLTGENAVFEVTEGRMLNVAVDGYTFERVAVHSSFPHSDPTHYISIRTKDNREVGLIKDIAAFSDEQRAILFEEMKIRYFSPVITHIIKVKDDHGYIHWAVETDCGECRFTVRGGGGSVIQPTRDRYVITDVDGNRFIIPDVKELPVKEYKMIDIYL